MKKLHFSLAFLLAFSAIVSALEVKLAWIFTDHAVLQREMPVPVWGITEPDVEVKAEINGIVAVTRSSRTGEFLLRLPELTAGGPYTLTVTATDKKNDATNSVSCQDVMVGDVWLAGGQSNMEYKLSSDVSKDRDLPLAERAHKTNIIQLNEYLANCTPEATIRAISVPLKTSYALEDHVEAVWDPMDKNHAGTLSAVGAWFGRNIQLATGIPVGIISCNWGGTRAESWMSRSALMSTPRTAQQLKEKDATFYSPEKVGLSEDEEKRKYILDNNLVDPGNKGIEFGWATPEFDDSDWADFTVPGSWMEQRILGNGILWARKTVQIPEKWVGKELLLKFGGIDKQDITYVNGTEVGHTGENLDEQYWGTPREYVVPATINTSTTLVIAVRAFSFIYDGSFNGDEERFALVFPETSESISLAGSWKAKAELDFGGVFRFSPSRKAVGTNPNTPGILFDSMLRPVIPYGIRGAIWYQGESNCHNRDDAIAYRNTLAAMIRDWRYQWGEGDFPFIQVQLAAYTPAASYNDANTWPYLRESQVLVCQTLSNVFMASALDIGDANDIHPQNKKEVGRRLAETALHHVYGKTDIVPFGPLFKDYAIEDNAIRLSFDNAKGLFFKDGSAKGFYIAGDNMEFVPASEVTIDGETIIVKSDKVDAPVAVRYSWSNNPDGNLYNAAELPASSFRTDK